MSIECQLVANTHDNYMLLFY